MKLVPIRERLTPLLPGIVLLLFLLQPCLDVLSYWMDTLGMANTLTLALRLVLLLGMVGLGFLLSRRKRRYVLLAGILGAFTACHVYFCGQSGYESLFSDLTNLIRIYQLPLTTLAFHTYLEENRDCLQAIRTGFAACLGLILAVELLSVLTGTEPYTYVNKSIGIRGWFYLPSAQSAILSILVPVAVVYGMERVKLHPVWSFLIGLTAFGMLYCFATRLTYAALLGTACALNASLLLLKWLKGIPAGRAAAAMALCAVLALVLFPVSPMERNQELVGINAGLKQQDIDALVAADDAAAVEAGLTGKDRELASLKSAYEKYLPGVTGRFGLERTAERYGYSTSVSNLSNTRLQKLNYCRFLLEDLPECRLFGLELTKMTFGGEVYDVENDFHGIYYLCGGVGLSLMIAFFAYFVWRIAAALCRDFRFYFTLENAGYGIALICGLAHAYFTAGVLRRPNTTFYLAVILAAVCVLTRREPEEREERHES